LTGSLWTSEGIQSQFGGCRCMLQNQKEHLALLKAGVCICWEQEFSKLTIVSPTGKPSRVEVAQGKVRHATERVASLVLSYSLTSIVRPLRQNLQ
uniref:Uncharacterized protein n=1 Tax=Anas zonorhyncha TaxID=75864 RepID=A0A8B9UYC7_9AVES